jgi:ParB family transcriptional regulator, chromosome partitioning protein
MSLKKPSLGRTLSDLGISELLSGTKNPTPSSLHNLQKVPIEFLVPGKYQPRNSIDPESLQELADSIKSCGIIQPIVVRKKAAENYEIIAGERRWRAAQLASLTEVPVVVYNFDDQQVLAMSLIENVQREDLNAIDIALSLKKLIDEFKLTHEEASSTIGKSRSTISNLLRLLELNEEVKKMVQQKNLEMGHARTLLPLDKNNQLKIAEIILAKDLSVRATEKLVRNWNQPKNLSGKKIASDPNLTKLEKELAQKIGAQVMIDHSTKGKGKLVIKYFSLDELDGILEHIR